MSRDWEEVREWPCSPPGEEETVGAKALRQGHACCVPEPSWEASDAATQ